MALADVERETEVTYIQRERDWIARATPKDAFRFRTTTCPSCRPRSWHGRLNGSSGGNGHGRRSERAQTMIWNAGPAEEESGRCR